ncbi:MAG: hypothetical protein HUJ63_10575, partial [Enterococcus sp.]|nr:hypothetical protein [Enterococcus sp.]
MNNRYIKTSLSEDGDSLFSSHFINEVLPQNKQFQKFDAQKFIDFAEGDSSQKSLKQVHAESKELNERQTEDALIRPVLECLGNKMLAQVPLGAEFMDFCIFKGDSFADNYTNTYTIVESKRHGRIENKYYVRKHDNSDEIYQSLNYLRTVNLELSNHGHKHSVDHIILTDGYKWRIYSNLYTHNVAEFEHHFIEFDLEKICQIEDEQERQEWLKLFAFFFSKQSLSGQLQKNQKSSQELEVAVTQELKEQTFTAVEYIATGIWRKIYNDKNPLYA